MDGLEAGIRGIGKLRCPREAMEQGLCVLEDNETIMVQICCWYLVRMKFCHDGYQMLACSSAVLEVAGVVVVEDVDCWVLRAQNIARLRLCRSRFWVDGSLQAGIWGIGGSSYREGAINKGVWPLKHSQARRV
jgi:hypothetical protein